MKTTTRKYIRTADIYYHGIEWGTPIGQIQFIWINNDQQIEVYHNNEKVFTTNVDDKMIHQVVKARLFVNNLIGNFLK